MDRLEPNTIYLEKVNEIYSRVSAESEIFDILYHHFSVRPKGFQFNPAYRNSSWDGHIRFLKASGLIYSGLVSSIVSFAKKNNLSIVDSRPEETDKEVTVEKYLSYLKEGIQVEKIVPRTYQNRAAVKALINKRGIILHSVASGKTLTSALILNYLRRDKKFVTFLYIVPRIQLIEQTVKALQEYGFSSEELGRYYGEAHELGNPITIATWQSLAGKKDRSLKMFLSNVQCLIVDEVHTAKAKVLRQVIEKVTNAQYRIGFTGTLPDAEKDPADDLLIRGIIGPVIDTELESGLMERKELAPIDIRVILLEHPNVKMKDYEFEREFIENCERRNNYIVDLANSHMRKGENVLVLVEKLEKQGFPLQELIKVRHGVSCPFIRGDVKVEEREGIREKVSTTGGNVVFATYGTFQLGINIPRLHTIILATSGKSKIRVIQSIGRGLRTHETKDLLIVYDISDDLRYSKGHLVERMQYYSERLFPCKVFREKEFLSLINTQGGVVNASSA